MTMSVGSVTGRFVSESQAIREAVYSRCLTVRGERWWRPSYGTLLYSSLGELADESNAPLYEGMILAALEADQERYTVVSVSVVVEQEGDVVAIVQVQSTAGGDIIEIRLSLSGGIV